MAAIYPPRTSTKPSNQTLNTSVSTASPPAPRRSSVNDTHANNRSGQELWEKEKRNVFQAEKPEVGVLLISWEIDEHPESMDTSLELADLTQIFESKYNFNVETRLLSTKKPQLPRYQLNSILTDFLTKYDRPGNLMFIYYGGHGDSSENGEDLMLISNPADDISPSTALNWSHVEPLLYNLTADLVLIFDCCYAGLVDRKKRDWPESRSRFQFIGSTPWDDEARGPKSRSSFTRALINALHDLSKEGGFSPETLMRKAKDSKNFRNTSQYPLVSSCGKSNSRPLMIRPIIEPQADADATRGAPNDNSINFYLHLKYVFKKPPSQKHIRALIDQLNEMIQNDRLPIDDVLWEGLSEYNPRMSVQDAAHMLRARLGPRRERSSAGHLEISASTGRPPAMLQRTLTHLTMDDGKLLSRSVNDAEKNTCIRDDSTVDRTRTSSPVVTLPFFFHPFCKPGRFGIQLTILAVTGAMIFWQHSSFLVYVWSWILQRVQSG